MLQWRYAMEKLLHVPPASFAPPPRVDSAAVRMLPHAQPAAVPRPMLEELVRLALSQRRKLLHHPLGPWLDAHQYAGRFAVRRRAEEVAVQQYLDLDRDP